MSPRGVWLRSARLLLLVVACVPVGEGTTFVADTAVVGLPVATLEVSSRLQCALQCRWMAVCVRWWEEDGVCLLWERTTTPSDVVPSEFDHVYQLILPEGFFRADVDMAYSFHQEVTGHKSNQLAACQLNHPAARPVVPQTEQQLNILKNISIDNGPELWVGIWLTEDELVDMNGQTLTYSKTSYRPSTLSATGTTLCIIIFERAMTQKTCNKTLPVLCEYRV